MDLVRGAVLRGFTGGRQVRPQALEPRITDHIGRIVIVGIARPLLVGISCIRQAGPPPLNRLAPLRVQVQRHLVPVVNFSHHPGQHANEAHHCTVHLLNRPCTVWNGWRAFRDPTAHTAAAPLRTTERGGFVTGAAGMGPVAVTTKWPHQVRGYYETVFDARLSDYIDEMITGVRFDLDVSSATSETGNSASGWRWA